MCELLTAPYARLNLDAAREAVNKAANAMLGYIRMPVNEPPTN
jgi:hypothetical protein